MPVDYCDRIATFGPAYSVTVAAPETKSSISEAHTDRRSSHCAGSFSADMTVPTPSNAEAGQWISGVSTHSGPGSARPGQASMIALL